VAIGRGHGDVGIVYRFGPQPPRAGGPNGSAPGCPSSPTVLWMVGLGCPSRLSAQLRPYNEVYGSLGAAVALLMWCLLCRPMSC
jgi:hypothetical protein